MNKEKKGDIRFVTLFRTSAGKNYILFSYDVAERDQQILTQEKMGGKLVKSYDRAEGEVK